MDMVWRTMSGRRPAKNIEAVIYGRTHHAGGNLALRVSQARACVPICTPVPPYPHFRSSAIAIANWASSRTHRNPQDRTSKKEMLFAQQRDKA
jgi:hypothetical protein